MMQLRMLLIFADTMAMAVLLAIPIGKVFGMVTQEIGAAAVFGWLIFLVPLLASALTLWGIQFSRPALTRPFVSVALLGCFLVACLSLYTCFMAPSDFARLGISAAILFSFNVLVLWEPFKDYLESVPPKSSQRPST